MNDVIGALKDVQGVAGACVFDTAGQVIANNLPAYYSSEMLVTIGRRFDELFEASEETQAEAETLILRYIDGWLLSRRWAGGKLLVFCANTVHAPALKTAASLTVKRLAKTSTCAAPLPSPVASAPTPASPEAAERPIPGKKQKTRSGIWG